MAISAPHYRCLKELHRRRELPQGGTVLEIGEANWYGDIEPPYRGDGYEVVKELYRDLFAAAGTVAIDFHGTASALQLDLNKPWVFRAGPYEAVINHGTAEHIFNIGQVFTTIHNNCRVGGLMIHESPFTGWIDHGFYSLHPTLYYDLAAANEYNIVFMAIEQIDGNIVIEVNSREQLLTMARTGGIPSNSMLFVALRKMADEPFRIPMQGVYAQNISLEAHEAWHTLR